MLSVSPHPRATAPDAEVQMASAATIATTHQPAPPLMTMIMTIASIMTLKTPMQAFWLAKPFSTVKLPEVERRSNSTMLRKDFNSDNNTRAKRRLSCAETSRCTEAASLVTPAHTLTVPTNSRRKHISQATS